MSLRYIPQINSVIYNLINENITYFKFFLKSRIKNMMNIILSNILEFLNDYYKI